MVKPLFTNYYGKNYYSINNKIRRKLVLFDTPTVYYDCYYNGSPYLKVMFYLIYIELLIWKCTPFSRFCKHSSISTGRIFFRLNRTKSSIASQKRIKIRLCFCCKTIWARRDVKLFLYLLHSSLFIILYCSS